MVRVRRAFTLVELLVVIAIIGVLVGLLLPAVQAARNAARRSQSTNHLKQLSLAVINYTDTHNELPSNGIFEFGYFSRASQAGPPRPEWADGCGWIYKILPFIEQTALYENWNFQTPVSVLLEPARGGTGLATREYDPSSADYWNNISYCGPITDYAANAMVIGSGMNVHEDPSNGQPIKNPDWYNNPSGWDHYKWNRIVDGTSNTVMLGIKALPTVLYENRGPGDFMLSNGALRDGRDDPITVAGSHHMGTIRSLVPDTTDYMADPMRDGLVPYYQFIPGNDWALKAGWPNWFHNSLMIYEDGPDIEPFNAWGTPYPGAGLFALCDGSVRVVGTDVDFEPWVGALTPNGGEAVNALVD